MHNTDEMSLFSSRAEKGLCSHAYIVDGADGIGKLDFALYCAQALLCTESRKPCGYCESCRKAASGNHPDIFIVGREKNPSIDDVREIIRRSSLKPNDGDKQVFIVCNGNKLRDVAQNALLKIFEEPPQTVAIFLLTESRSSLLPTVLSRGQRIHLDGMRDSEIAKALHKKYPEATETEINRAIAISNGNCGKAVKYLSKESVSLREKSEKLLLCLLNKDSYGVNSLLLLPKYTREQLHAFMEEFVAYITEIQKQKYGVEGSFITANGRILATNKKALAHMGEAAYVCIMSLEASANMNAAKGKLVIDLLRASVK